MRKNERLSQLLKEHTDREKRMVDAGEDIQNMAMNRRATRSDSNPIVDEDSSCACPAETGVVIILSLTEL